jgi:hypothetical protein
MANGKVQPATPGRMIVLTSICAELAGRDAQRERCLYRRAAADSLQRSSDQLAQVGAQLALSPRGPKGLWSPGR